MGRDFIRAKWIARLIDRNCSNCARDCRRSGSGNVAVASGTNSIKVFEPILAEDGAAIGIVSVAAARTKDHCGKAAPIRGLSIA
jgi:hypothetical protein